jgi:Flp pilus assembly protein TadG
MMRRNDERGQAMVEFALIATVLATLLLAIFQFGQTFTNYISVADAARAAARKAATEGATTTYDSSWVSTVRALAKSNATDSAGDTCAGNVCTTTITALNGVDSNWVAGNPVTATVTAPYSIDIFGLSITSGTLKHSVTMRIQSKSPT